jgi:hypothetical protein
MTKGRVLPLHTGLLGINLSEKNKLGENEQQPGDWAYADHRAAR